MNVMRTRTLFLVILLCIGALCAQAQNLTDEEREVIEQRIKEKIDDFISYLPEIAAKSDRPMEEREYAQKYIGKALDLFMGKGYDYKYIDQDKNERMHDAVKMQTTSRGIPNPPHYMRSYLPRLMALKYQEVEIDTCSAVRIDKHIHHVGNGKYTATASFVQAFRGWREGRMVINDKDMKQVTVYIERRVVKGPDGEDVFWIIRLGDIRITTDWGEIARKTF